MFAGNLLKKLFILFFIGINALSITFLFPNVSYFHCKPNSLQAAGYHGGLSVTIFLLYVFEKTNLATCLLAFALNPQNKGFPS